MAEQIKDELKNRKTETSYSRYTKKNFKEFKEILTRNETPFILVQYPCREVDLLKKMLGTKNIFYVGNERVFKDALKIEGFNECFSDNFGGDFGHCTPKGCPLHLEMKQC